MFSNITSGYYLLFSFGKTENKEPFPQKGIFEYRLSKGQTVWILLLSYTLLSGIGSFTETFLNTNVSCDTGRLNENLHITNVRQADGCGAVGNAKKE